ncbi:hypothetical protein B0H12DRAFT_1133089 [Mycena haematopus]|nr:hypothetical protein B0H12DRAFT_1133089 [Mycena haematopus]
MREVGSVYTPMSSVSSPGTSKSPGPSRIFSAFRTMRWITLGLRPISEWNAGHPRRKPQPDNVTE